MGYSDIGCYGGEIHTPNIDRLAAEGIKFRRFYNAARCCPTRASLLTGLYPHQAGMGWMTIADLGRPAYAGNLNTHSVTIAEVLKTAGYATYMSGKWHVTNQRKVEGMVTDNWPKQRGFDRYFGILPGGGSYFTPELYSDNQKYPAPPGFYLTNAISDTSVKFIGEHFKKNPQQPMFLYVAYTSPHWPLHALQKDMAKYKDTYTVGWDVLRQQRFERQKHIGLLPQNAVISSRDATVPAWDSLSPEKQKDMAMRMSVYAAQIDIMDQGIGRILQKLKEENQLDNTLIFFLSDNGACAEYVSRGKSRVPDGTEDSFESYRINWANAGSTPFKEYKHFTYEGGIATPLIIHWPKGINKKLDNMFVSGYGHISDIMATCVEVAGAKYPVLYKGNSIQPMAGKSLVPFFSGKDNHRGAIYWEHEGNMAIRDGRWKLVASTPVGETFNPDNLRLYDLEADPSEVNDLSGKYPQRVKALFAAWTHWGEKVGIFPLDTREYGQRRESYQREINGDFNDNLGGWEVYTAPNTEAAVLTDTSGKLHGKKSVYIAVKKPGNTEKDVRLDWPFKGFKGEKYTVRFSAISSRNTTLRICLEPTSENGKMLLDKEHKVSANFNTTTFQSVPVPEEGFYRLSFYAGKMSAGDKVWIDNIELIPQPKN